MDVEIEIHSINWNVWTKYDKIIITKLIIYWWLYKICEWLLNSQTCFYKYNNWINRENKRVNNKGKIGLKRENISICIEI